MGARPELASVPLRLRPRAPPLPPLRALRLSDLNTASSSVNARYTQPQKRR